MREDPKIEMPCVIPSSNPVPWKSSEIGHMFQEQGRNPYGCMNWHFRSETLQFCALAAKLLNQLNAIPRSECWSDTLG